MKKGYQKDKTLARGKEVYIPDRYGQV